MRHASAPTCVLKLAIGEDDGRSADAARAAAPRNGRRCRRVAAVSRAGQADGGRRNVAMPIAPAFFSTAQRSPPELTCDFTLSGTSTGAVMFT